ncbi:uncharacterized protein [Venturia canescens]|uniref:uncharacterized protein isoform X2 n=1 Tax=Venturia canescens TaxID=32260 RepID=UPI001C9D5575|nr:uncharacterized protein LOC122417629 isoform X2 [Venturia canescens]
MINTYLTDNAWFYWVITAAAFFSFVGFLLACICSCRRHENKASGANRSLPDIPKDKHAGRDREIESAPQEVIYEATEIIGDTSELYATVQDKKIDKKRNFDKEIRSNNQETSSILDDSGYPYARLNTLESGNDEHPYAQVQSIQKTEYSQQIRNNVNQYTDNNQPSTSTSHAPNGGNPVAPPRTRRSSSHNSLLSVETTCDIQAANAITGGVQANQDLPYMTPPILLPLPRPPQSQQNVPHQHFSGDSQDSKGYTSISVREPLANIIAQTKGLHTNRQGSRSLTDPHYATVSDDSDEMYAAIDEQDKVYTSGSETYAQIQPMTNEVNRTVQVDQQVSNQVPLRGCGEDLNVSSAPQPPSVDSLRHVAHAHSRQASSSSATSSIANPGSPKPEKRQANSPLPPPPPPPPAPTESGNGDFYASVDKRNKSEDRTRSSISSGKSLEDMYAKVMKKKRDNDENIPFDVGSAGGPSYGPEIVSSTRDASSNRKLSLVEISRASWSSHDSVEIQKREPDATHSNLQNSVDVFNAEMDLEFMKIARTYELDSPSVSGVEADGYEPLANRNKVQQTSVTQNTRSGHNDPNYEMLRPQFTTNASSSSQSNVTRNGIDVLLPIYSLPFKHRQVSNASSDDPGYERVRLRRHVDLDQDTDSEPNYESMPHETNEPNYASVCRPGDSDTDPNYESVTHGDPNYESVRYMSVSRNNDPPYEQVNNYKEQNNERPDNSVGYEKVKRGSGPIDPNYERIGMTHNDTIAYNDSGDTDDEQYVQV